MQVIPWTVCSSQWLTVSAPFFCFYISFNLQIVSAHTHLMRYDIPPLAIRGMIAGRFFLQESSKLMGLWTGFTWVSEKQWNRFYQSKPIYVLEVSLYSTTFHIICHKPMAWAEMRWTILFTFNLIVVSLQVCWHEQNKRWGFARTHAQWSMCMAEEWRSFIYKMLYDNRQ